MATTILDQLNRLREFDIEVDIPEGLNLPGIIPFNAVISENKGKFKVLATSFAEAEQKIADALRSGGFVRSPQVNIILRQVRGNQVADQLNGHTIVFNNTTEVIQVDGRTQDSPNARDQRVRATLTPRQNPSAPATAPAQTAPRPVLRNSPGLAMPSKQ